MGVLAVYGVPDASTYIYYGLHNLQHRGQEGGGIATFDSHGDSHRYRGLGLLNEIFNNGQVGKLQGSLGIGCVKYANASRGGLDNVGPFFFRHHSGDFCVASDGNLVNSKQIAEYLEKRGTIFQTDTDAELLAHLIKKSASEDRIVNIVKALNMMEGGYTFVVMTKNRIYAARDKYGIKPLCIGKIGDGYVVSSESCAFGIMGAEFIRDVRPGEIISLDHHGIRSTIFSKFCKHRMCGMEYIYFARPDSDIDGCNVHAYRKEAGRRLYRECPVEADMVVGVPESSLSAAMGYAEESGIPYEMGLIKHKYVGRTFIEPVQSMRELGVKMKLEAVPGLQHREGQAHRPGGRLHRPRHDFPQDRPAAPRGGRYGGPRAHRQPDDAVHLPLRCGHVHPGRAPVLAPDAGGGLRGHRRRLPWLPEPGIHARLRLRLRRPVPGLLHGRVSDPFV